MIDLEQANLPSRLVSPDGEVAPVRTDFRTWLRFSRLLAEEKVLWLGIFPEEKEPNWSWVDAALEFLESRNVCPRKTKRANVRTMDIYLDGDYVVAAFEQAYGLDLTSPGLDMHWHRFLALLRGLPNDTKLAEIASWRSFEKRKSKRKTEDVYEELREDWALPSRSAEIDENIIAWQKQVFGGIKPQGGGADGRR